MDSELVSRLHSAIKHGDAEHQAWLLEALTAFFANAPIPEPCGKGNKEAQIESLSSRLREAEEALPVFERVTRLADTLACDVPITVSAREHIDAAYKKLAALNRKGSKR